MLDLLPRGFAATAEFSSCSQCTVGELLLTSSLEQVWVVFAFNKDFKSAF